MIKRNAQTMFITIAVCSWKIRTGTRKVRATRSFARKVEIVAVQIFSAELLVEDSCEMWMPSASENASEIATVRIPAMTAVFRLVAESSPMITPSVVITPDVRPNAMPAFFAFCIVERGW